MNWRTRLIITAIADERAAQDEKWGEQNHPDGTSSSFHDHAADARATCQAAARAGTVTWRHIFHEEAMEAFAETDPAALRAELIQVAAVAAAWIECLDRNVLAP